MSSHIYMYVCNTFTSSFFIIFLGGFTGRQEGQVAVIARTNSGLFKEVIATLEESPKARLRFTGAVNFTMLEDIFHLKCGNKSRIKTARIKKYKDKGYHQLKHNAEQAEDQTLLHLIKVFNTAESTAL